MAFTQCLGAKASESINIAAALAVLNRELNVCPCTEFVPDGTSCDACGHHRWDHEAREFPEHEGGCMVSLRE